MRVSFPYPESYVDVPDGNLIGVFGVPECDPPASEQSVIASAIEKPIGTPRLCDLARGRDSVLIVCDDVARPTPPPGR